MIWISLFLRCCTFYIHLMLYLLCYRWNPEGWYLHCTDLGHKGRYAWKFCEFIISIWVMPNIKLKPTSRSVSCHHICSHDDDNAVHACHLLWAKAKKQSVSCSSAVGTCATAPLPADTAHAGLALKSITITVISGRRLQQFQRQHYPALPLEGVFSYLKFKPSTTSSP